MMEKRDRGGGVSQARNRNSPLASPPTNSNLDGYLKFEDLILENDMKLCSISYVSEPSDDRLRIEITFRNEELEVYLEARRSLLTN